MLLLETVRVIAALACPTTGAVLSLRSSCTFVIHSVARSYDDLYAIGGEGAVKLAWSVTAMCEGGRWQGVVRTVGVFSCTPVGMPLDCSVFRLRPCAPMTGCVTVSNLRLAWGPSFGDAVDSVLGCPT